MISRLLVVLALVRTAAADPLASVPARYQAVGWFGGANAPLFGFWHSMPGGAPPCVEKLLAAADGYFQAQRAKVKGSLIIFHGKLERAATEACVHEVMDTLAVPHPRITAMGVLTEVATDSYAFYLGWPGDGSVIEAHEKADVEEVLAHETQPNRDLLAMVARVDRKMPMWFAGAIDYTAPLLGVPSLGYFASLDVTALKAAAKANGPESVHAFVTLVFGKAADAKRAAAAIDGAAHNKRFSAALQAQLGKLGATVKGADLVVDLSPLFWKPELLEEMTKAISELASH